MTAPEQRTFPRDTPTRPGWGALASCRHGYGTIWTAITRLEQDPPPWPAEMTTEAVAQLRAAAELVRAVGTAVREAADTD